MSTLLSRFFASSADKPEDIVAIQSDGPAGRRTLSSVEWRRLSLALAGSLRANGIRAGDCAAACTGFGVDWLVFDAAVRLSGCAALCLDWRCGEAACFDALSLAHCRVCLVDSNDEALRLAAQAKRLPDLALVVVCRSGGDGPSGGPADRIPIVCLDALTDPQQAPEPAADDPRAIAALALAPAADGENRVALLSAEALARQAGLVGGRLPPRAAEGRTLCAFSALDPLARPTIETLVGVGGTVVFAETGDLRARAAGEGCAGFAASAPGWEALLAGGDGPALAPGRLNGLHYRRQERRIARLAGRTGLDSLARKLLRLGDSRKLREALGPVRWGLAGGGVAPTCLADAAAMGLAVLRFAASAECGPFAAAGPAYPALAAALLPDCAVALSDGAGQTAAAGEWAPLKVRSPGRFTGYARQPLKTREAIDREGAVASQMVGRMAGSAVELAGPAAELVRLPGRVLHRPSLESALRCVGRVSSARVEASEAGRLSVRLRLRGGGAAVEPGAPPRGVLRAVAGVLARHPWSLAAADCDIGWEYEAGL